MGITVIRNIVFRAQVIRNFYVCCERALLVMTSESTRYRTPQNTWENNQHNGFITTLTHCPERWSWERGAPERRLDSIHITHQLEIPESSFERLVKLFYQGRSACIKLDEVRQPITYECSAPYFRSQESPYTAGGAIHEYLHNDKKALAL